MKDAEGNVSSFEIDEVDELKPFLDVAGDAGGLLTPEDVEHAAMALAPDSSAALMIWEDLWAAEFADALRSSGGVVSKAAGSPSSCGKRPSRPATTDDMRGPTS